MVGEVVSITQVSSLLILFPIPMHSLYFDFHISFCFRVVARFHSPVVLKFRFEQFFECIFIFKRPKAREIFFKSLLSILDHFSFSFGKSYFDLPILLVFKVLL